MILYHGSDIVVNAPQLVIQNRMLDFGPGFYTTTNLDQAINFAGKVMVRRNSPLGYVSFYELDLPEAEKELDILTFNIADEFWLDFVLQNRTGTYRGKQYDAFFGPVADDDVFRTLALYEAGVLTRLQTLDNLRIKKLFNQMTFATVKALDRLLFVEAMTIEG